MAEVSHYKWWNYVAFAPSEFNLCLLIINANISQHRIPLRFPLLLEYRHRSTCRVAMDRIKQNPDTADIIMNTYETMAAGIDLLSGHTPMDL